MTRVLRKWLTVFALAASATAVLASSPADATALSAFHTPGWTVQCYVVGEEHPPVLSCSKPSDGFFLQMGAGGRVQTGINPKNRHFHDPFAARRLLGFGRYWKFGSGFGCLSRSSGLKCWNKAGHGWWLGRPRGYRTF
jgi:hypothetical protein